METIKRKSSTLYEFNDEFACRKFASRLERILRDGDMSREDIKVEAKKFFGEGFKDEALTDVSWRDYSHNVSSDNIHIRIWNSVYATMTIDEESKKKELTLDDFRKDLDKAMQQLYDKYAHAAILNQLDDSIVMFKITEDGFGVERIYKEVQ